jgi:hypothetical protein
MIAVWFSCGAASAVAAKLTVHKYGATDDVRIVNNPVLEEDPDNLRFAQEVAAWIGRPIETAGNPKFLDNSCVSVWDKERFMSGPHGAPCTKFLKKHARQLWEKENAPDWHVLGFTVEEAARHERFILTERANVLPILIENRISKAECFAIIHAAGIDLPAAYKRGCVKSSSATYWNHVREQDPDVFTARAEQSRRIGAKLVMVKGRRIFLDELKTTDKGRPLKTMQFECGIFCEEPV